MIESQKLYEEYMELRDQHDDLSTEFKDKWGSQASLENRELLRRLVDTGRAMQAKLQDLQDSLLK